MRYVNDYLAERSSLQVIERLLQVIKSVASIDHRSQANAVDGADKIFRCPAMTGDDALNDGSFEQNGHGRRGQLLGPQKPNHADTPPGRDHLNRLFEVLAANKLKHLSLGSRLKMPTDGLDE